MNDGNTTNTNLQYINNITSSGSIKGDNFKTNSTNSFALNDTNNVNKTILQNISSINASSISLTTGTISTTPTSNNDITNKLYVDTHTIDLSQTIHFTNSGTSIITDGNANIKGNATIGENTDTNQILLNNTNGITSKKYSTTTTSNKEFAVYDTTNTDKTILQNISTINTSGNISAGGNVSATGSVSGASYSVGNTSIISKTGNNINISGINDIGTTNLSVSNDILSNGFKTNSTNSFALNDTNNTNKTKLHELSAI